jgi:putative copper export protein
MIQELLAAYEASALGHAARNSVWLYPIANLVHVLGASLLVGAIAVFDILVLRQRYQTASNAGRVAIPLAATGLALQAASGLVLFSAEATTIARNPAFLFKMIMLVIGLANVAAFHAWHRVSALAEDDRDRAIRVGAMVSLGAWILVLLAGRAIAYG